MDHYDRCDRALKKVLNSDNSVRALWERSNSTYSKFDPGFKAGYTGQSAVRNGAREILEYWRISNNITFAIYNFF